MESLCAGIARQESRTTYRIPPQPMPTTAHNPVSIVERTQHAGAILSGRRRRAATARLQPLPSVAACVNAHAPRRQSAEPPLSAAISPASIATPDRSSRQTDTQTLCKSRQALPAAQARSPTEMNVASQDELPKRSSLPRNHACRVHLSYKQAKQTPIERR